MEKQFKNIFFTILVLLIGFDIFLWSNIFYFYKNKPEIYFLDVGQGDSSLIVLPNNVLILVDAGPNVSINPALAQIFPKFRNYIDLAIITHPQLDHFGGFFDLLDRYDFGTFIINGKEGDEKIKDTYNQLIQKIKSKNISLISLKSGDKIVYKDNLLEFIFPDDNWLQSLESNDSALVFKLKTQKFNALFTSDISSEVEKYLIKKFDLKSDILKIPHHGSKYSSEDDFLKFVAPKLALIGVGLKNTFGHPAQETLQKLKLLNIPIFRTDYNGSIKIYEQNNKLIIQTEK